MSSRFSFPFFFAACLMATLVVAAADDAARVRQAWPQTLYVLRVFTLPKAEGMDLLAKDMTDSALHQHLMEMAKATSAVLEKLMLVASNNDAPVELQQANELLYPTEFDPQQIPQNLAIGDAALVPALLKFFEPLTPPTPTPTPPVPAPVPPDGKPQDKPETTPTGRRSHRGAPHVTPTASHRTAGVAPAAPVPGGNSSNGGLGIITCISPTAFEIQPLGDRLKLTANNANGALATQVDFQSTKLAGFQVYNGEMQAQFASRKLIVEAVLGHEAPCFLGTCSAPQHTGGEFENQEATVSLAFLTARSLSRPAEVKEVATDPEAVLSALFEVISLTKQDASALVDEALDEAAMHGRLKSAMQAGTARLETFLTGRVVSGSASVLEEADEYIYPTEFDPPQVAQNLMIADDDLLADLRAGRQTGLGHVPSADNPYNGGFGLMTSICPTAFQTRRLGVKLEIETARDGSQLTMKVKPQLTRLIGEKRYVNVAQPLFESDFLSTTVMGRLGVPQLVGSLSRPLNTGLKEENQEERVWFAFITVRAAR